MNQMQARIRQRLDAIPTIDVHTHLGTRGLWQARNLADIVSYHWVNVELARAAGQVFVADPRGDPEGYMHEALPHMPAVRQTVNHYALMGLLRDLYGFQGRMLTEDNWREVDQAVRQRSQDSGWFRQVLQRGKVERVSVCYREGAPEQPTPFIPYDLGEYLYAVDSTDCLRQIVGADAPLPETPEALSMAIGRRVDWLAAQQDVRALHICPYPSVRYPGWEYAPGDVDEVGASLRRLLAGAQLSPRERRALISFSADATAAAAGRYGIVLQLFHGSISYTRTNRPSNISYWDPQFLQSHTFHFDKHPQTRFDLFLGTRIPSHEAALLARVYFNVMVSGAWWHAFTPSTMLAFFRDRLEMLPNTVWSAFFSDAYMVEWVYGKLLVTKNILARALAEMVEEGYLGEEDAGEVARRLLYDNPVAAYCGHRP